MDRSRLAHDEARWERVVSLQQRVESRLATVLAEAGGLSLSEYRALTRLAHASDGELRMQDIADSIGLNQSSVSRLVGRLERAGLVRRDLCPSDRRGIYSVITPEGRRVARDARTAYRSALSSTLDELATEPEFRALVRALRA